MKRTLNKTAIIALACLSLTLGACSTLDRIGDGIDASCASGVLTTTQGYIDQFNDYLTNKGRLYRIDGITCI